MTGALVVLITAPDEETAAGIGRTFVEEGLAACVNLVPRIRSIYRWQGEVADEAETLMIVKTRSERLEEMKKRLGELHPYETPELLALSVEAGAERYLAWVAESTGID